MPWVEPITRRAAWVVIATAVIAFLSFAQDFLLPLALAILLAFMLSPVVRWLNRRLGSRPLSVTLACMLGGTIVVGVGAMAAVQALDFLEQLPAYRHSISKKLIAIRGSSEGVVGRALRTMNDIQKDVETAAATQPVGEKVPMQLPPIPVVSHEDTGLVESLRSFVEPVIEPALVTVIVAVLVFLLLIYGEELRDRVVVMAGAQQLTVTSQALEDASQRIGRYLLMLSLVNAFFGASIGIGLMVIGLPNALLLGLIAGLLRYVPVLGAWLGAGLPVLLALAVTDSWAPVIQVIVLFAFFEALVNFAIEPYVYGHSTGISGVGVLLAILFWTWIWGPAGLLLAVPITVCLVVFGKYIEPLRVFHVLLSDEPMLSPQRRLYHRVVSGDLASAEQLYDQSVKSVGLTRTADEIMLPVLDLARGDHDRSILSDDRFDLALQTIEQIVDDEPRFVDKTAPVGAIGIVAATEEDRAAAGVVARATAQGLSVELPLLTSSLVTDIAQELATRALSAVVIVGIGPESAARGRLIAKSLSQRSPGVQLFLLDPFPNGEADRVGRVQLVRSVHVLIERLRPLIQPRPTPSDNPDLRPAVVPA